MLLIVNYQQPVQKFNKNILRGFKLAKLKT